MRTEVAVVGAGPAGLAMGMELAGRGIDHFILERGRVGEVWRTQRWDSFRLNTPAWMNGVVADAAGSEPNGFATRAEMVACLERVAAALPLREHAAVTRLRRVGDRFALETTDSELAASAVVVASGGLNVPKRPSADPRLSARLAQIYTSDYRSSSDLPDGAVLIVGGGQSGAQIAEDLIRSERRTYLSTSKAWRMPWLTRGRQTLAWLVELGFYDVRPDQLPDPALLRLAQPVIAPGGRSLSLQSLAGQGVTLLPKLDGIEGALLTFAGSVADAIVFGDQGAATLRGLVHAYIESRGFDAPADAVDPTEEPCVVEHRETLDLRDADIASVIWACGFGCDLSWVEPVPLDGWAVPVHRGLVSEVPGLYFLGMPWLQRRGSGVLFRFQADAAVIADDLTATRSRT